MKIAKKELTKSEKEIVQDDLDFMYPPAKKKRAKPAKESKSTLEPVNIKMSPETRKRIKACAAKYADGNESAWLRHAALHYKPKQGEKVSLKRY